MSQFRAFLSTFLLFITLSAFGQIEKGNYNFGGDVELNGRFSKTSYTQITGFNASFSPSINKFLTNKLMVGFRPILSTYINSGHSGYRPDNESESVTQLGIEASGRYYFNENRRINYFAFSTASFNRAFQTFKSPNFNIDASSQSNFYNLKSGFGADVIINEDVAIEGKFSYFHLEQPLEIRTLNPNIYSPNKSDNLELIVNLNHFIKPFSLKQAEENTEYIKKGRQILSGHVRLWAEKEDAIKIAYLNFQISPQFGQFITDRWLLSGALNVGNVLTDFTHSGADISIMGRYYKPISNRFFVYPQMAFLTSFAEHFSIAEAGFGLNVGAGGSYFLSENVALDASFLAVNLGLMGYLDTSLGAEKIGLLYFIR
jgi:hypothetical protein